MVKYITLQWYILVIILENIFPKNRTEEIIQTLLEDKLPKPGSAKNRKNTAPEKGKTTLLEVKNA